MKAKDVKLAYAENPELKEIGTATQYFKYLKTIFPESKFKDIFYHGTKTEKSKEDILQNGFNFSKIKNKLRGEGLSIATNPEFTKGFGKYPISLIINAKNYKSNFEIQRDNLDENSFDLITDYSWGLSKAGAVTKPENIHVLGSKKDIQGFEDFVSKKDSLEKRIVSGVFIFSIIAGLFFSSLNITGNVVGSTNNSSFIGIGLFLTGLLGFYLNKNK